MNRIAIGACAAAGLLAPACTDDVEPELETPSAPAPASTGLPESFTCTKKTSAGFFPVVPPPIFPDVTPNGDAPPTVTNAREIEGPWGADIVIEGTAFGTGSNGEYVSFGEGDREMRVPTKGRTSETRIGVPVPFGAEGKIAVHTRGGTADAGTIVPPWRASRVLTFAEGEDYGRTLAAIDTANATYVLRSSSRAREDGTTVTHLTLHRFASEGLAVAVLDDLGAVTRATFARAANGEVDLALVTVTKHLHVAHVRADAADFDDGCVPADSAGPLAFGVNDGGRVAWVTITTNAKTEQYALVRLVDSGGTGTWKVDRVVAAKDALRGDGVELADGSVGFAWGEGAGALFDSKAIPKVAFLAPGGTEIESMPLASAMDDYVETRTFATPSGLVMTYCNTDDTGFLNDSSKSGVNCRVLLRRGPGDWNAFDGYPNSFANRDYDFGLVAGRIAAVHRGADGSGTHVYRATADATPSPIAVGAREVSFVAADGAAPVLFVAGGGSAMVVRAR